MIFLKKNRCLSFSLPIFANVESLKSRKLFFFHASFDSALGKVFRASLPLGASASFRRSLELFRCSLALSDYISFGSVYLSLLAHSSFSYILKQINENKKSIHAHNRREVNTRSIISDICFCLCVVFFSYQIRNPIVSNTSLNNIFVTVIVIWIERFFLEKNWYRLMSSFFKIPPSMTSKSDSVSSHCHYGHVRNSRVRVLSFCVRYCQFYFGRKSWSHTFTIYTV